MEKVKQISVFLENKPGRLGKVLSGLAKEKINVTALTVMDSQEHSVLRVVTSDNARTIKALKALSAPYAEAEVLLVDLRNQPGALAHVCETLATEHINIDYCYASSGGRNGRVMGVFKVSNSDRASKLLAGQGKKGEGRPLRDRRIYSTKAR